MPNEREALAPGSGSALEPEPGDISIQLMPLSYGTLILVSDPATERYAVAPAPGSLQRVQSFLNTRGTGLPAEPDLLVSAASANRWLRTLQWPGTPRLPAMPRLTADDLTPLRELRGALQAQLEAGRDAPQTAPQPDLAHYLEQLRWTMTLKEGQLALSAEGPGWRQVAGTLLSDILAAQQHELWPRLKACRNPLCSVVFYDNSKNQARVWHNTSVCGNLINLRASRARRREQAS
jgi:predicted RNA-binding Zn ribbon-like protein